MKISFSNKFTVNDDLVILYSNGSNLLKTGNLDSSLKNVIEKVDSENKAKNFFLQSFNIPVSSKIKHVILSKLDFSSNESNLESIAGRILSELERLKLNKISVILEQISNRSKLNSILKSLTSGFLMKDYRFEKYKTITKKDFKVQVINFISNHLYI